MSRDPDAVRGEVRDRYARAALAVIADEPARCCGPDGGCGSSACCDASATDPRFGEALYDDAQRGELPDAARAASLGCGNPTAVAELAPGEVVLDLGSGGGIDAILSARRVGPDGFVYGVDMTDEMLALARTNAAAAGVANVEFRKGAIEALPLGDATVDVAISNCVVNLSPDKPAVFRELARVLRPGGRIGISDVVAEDRLSTADRAARGGYTACIAGALAQGEYARLLADAGLVEVSVELTHEVADGMHGAIIRARRPA